MPDSSLLFFHSPPEISDFLSAERGKVDLFGGHVAENGFTQVV